MRCYSLQARSGVTVPRCVGAVNQIDTGVGVRLYYSWLARIDSIADHITMPGGNFFYADGNLGLNWISGRSVACEKWEELEVVAARRSSFGARRSYTRKRRAAALESARYITELSERFSITRASQVQWSVFEENWARPAASVCNEWRLHVYCEFSSYER